MISGRPGEPIPVRQMYGRIALGGGGLMGEGYWASEPRKWREITRFKLPHKCEYSNHWFWGEGVWAVNWSDIKNRCDYRCGACHAMAVLAGETHEPYTQSFTDALNREFDRLLGSFGTLSVSQEAGGGLGGSQTAGGPDSAEGSGVADQREDGE